MNIAALLDAGQYWHERLSHRPTYSAQHLAHELRVPAHEVAKTVLLRAGANDAPHYFVAVLPANKQIDLVRAARFMRLDSVEIANEAEIAACCPDCDMGVLPPFGSQYGMKTIVDTTLAHAEHIWFDANSYHEAIGMKFEDFRRLEKPKVGAIAADG